MNTNTPRYELWEIQGNLCGHNVDIENCLNEDCDIFDRRKFGKFVCTCKKQFNPFFYSQTKPRSKWRMVWVADSHREPKQSWESICPGCKRPFLFSIHIPQ